MTKLKICGIKNIEELKIINLFEIDYAGFILAKSKREISIETLNYLITNLDKKIIPVGVFVNADFEKILQAVKCGVKIVQLHGDEDYYYINELRKKLNNFDFEIWKSIRIQNNKPNEGLFIKNADRFLFDKYIKNIYGGTGEKFDWKIVSQHSKEYSIILAGGVNSDNAVEALKIVKPFCIDLSSGVESDGLKDKEKIKILVNLLKEYNSLLF